MKADKMRSMPKVELLQLLDKMYKEQLNLRLQKATGQTINSAQLKQLRRNVARIKTILREVGGSAI